MAVTSLPVFTRITVDACFARTELRNFRIAWLISKSYTAPGPWTFIVERSPDAEHWVEVARTVDTPWAFDVNSSQTHGVFYYRVRLIPSQGAEEVSEAVESTTGYWNKNDWRLAKEIIRRERLFQRKAGIPGFLLKRRIFGDMCSCVDRTTKLPQNATCKTCYGTGIIGGYHEPQHVRLVLLSSKSKTGFQEKIGVASDVFIVARVLAEDFFAPNDCFIHAYTHQMYRVGPEINSVANWRGIDLIHHIGLALLSPFDILSHYPLPEFKETIPA